MPPYHPSPQVPHLHLLPTQHRFLHAPASSKLDIAVYQGGFGSGKTWVGCLLGLLLCAKHPGILVLSVAKTYPLLKETTLRTYKEHLDQWGWEAGKHYKLTESTGNTRLIFPGWGNAEILFRHLQNPEKLKSLNVGAIQIEELSQITEQDFLMLLSRLRQPSVGRWRLFAHTNPHPDANGWIARRFPSQDEGLRMETLTLPDGRTLQSSWRRVFAPTRENTFLPPHYVATLASQYDPDLSQRYLEGTDAQEIHGRVVKHFSQANMDETLAYRPDQELVLSCDFNVDPMGWVIGHRVRCPQTGNIQYEVFDELTLRHTTTQEAAELFVSRYGKHRAGILITGDASGQFRRSSASSQAGRTDYDILMNTLLREGVRPVVKRLPAGNPPIIDRINSVNALVCNAQGERRLKVHPTRCPWLVYNLTHLRYYAGTRQIQLPTPQQLERDPQARYLGHLYDALGYWVMLHDPIRRQADTGSLLRHGQHLTARQGRTALRLQSLNHPLEDPDESL
ncbi:MAG: phage terminase large subunit [Vampirovibrionales bacterium]